MSSFSAQEGSPGYQIVGVSVENGVERFNPLAHLLGLILTGCTAGDPPCQFRAGGLGGIEVQSRRGLNTSVGLGDIAKYFRRLRIAVPGEIQGGRRQAGRHLPGAVPGEPELLAKHSAEFPAQSKKIAIVVSFPHTRFGLGQGGRAK